MKKTPTIVIIAALCISSIAYAENSTYVIKKGDTLYGLCKKYDVSIDSLKRINNISDPSTIFPGMVLTIPGGYTVKKGDTLYGIARLYQVNIDELAAQNNMKITDVLHPGRLLIVPSSAVPETVSDPGGNVAEGTVEAPHGDDSAAADTDKGNEDPAAEKAAYSSDSEYYWPHYGNRSELTGKLRGIQIEGNPGDKVVSVSGGTVVWASEYGIYKKLVLVESLSGIVYGYGGNDKSMVNVGDAVKAGSVIGFLGGMDDESDAYFFVYKDGKPIDPVKAPRVF